MKKPIPSFGFVLFIGFVLFLLINPEVLKILPFAIGCIFLIGFFDSKNKSKSLKSEQNTQPSNDGNLGIQSNISSCSTDSVVNPVSKDKTIRQFAQILQIPLGQMLKDFNQLGYSCNPDDLLNKEMRDKFTRLRCERTSATSETIERKMIREEEDFKVRKEAETKAREEIEALAKRKAINEETIKSYSKISQLPLKLVLDDLKRFGYSCEADDILTKDMRQKLVKLFKIRLIAKRLKSLNEKELNELIEKNEIKKAIQLISKHEALEIKIEEERLALEIKAKEEKLALELKAKEEERLALEIKAKEEELALEVKAKAEVESLVKSKKNELLPYAETEAAELFETLKKTGKIIDLLLELAPKKVYASVTETITNQLFVDFVCLHFSYEYLKSLCLSKRTLEAYKELKIIKPSQLNILNDEVIKIELQVSISEIILKKSIWHEYPRGWSLHSKSISENRRKKLYSAAIVEIISYFISYLKGEYLLEISDKLFDNNLCVIGELLFEMGAINSALMLNSIDERFFDNSNLLSLLANGAIKMGQLDQSNKLLAKIIEQEPYHPSIPMLKADIQRLEQRHLLQANFSLDFSEINELSGLEFENLLMDKFLALGFKVESTPKTGDFGADLIIENSEGTRIIVQCKRFKSKVNLKAVQEVVGAMGHYFGDMGIVITNNSFLNSAVKLAESHDIELWDGDKLLSFLSGDLSFSDISGNK